LYEWEEKEKLMKKMIIVLFALSFTLLIIPKVGAQIVFFADFEDDSKDAVPDKDVNDIANWKPENAGQVWALGPFPNGTQGLKQTVEGCGISGNTPLPGVENFTDGVIQLEMSWGDDDSWGIIFRQSAKDKGYLVVFGYIETQAVILARLDDGCGVVGKCLDEVACENNPANTIEQVPHGLGALNMGNTDAYLGRIEARGDNIKVWYRRLDDVGDPLGDLGPPILEATDATHKSGTVGVWHESQGGSMIDNVLVTTASLFSVDARDKLAATWAKIKTGN
jgi:hypothetical protein